MTERKRWPNHAEAARMEALAEARRGLRAISPVLNDKCPETIRNAAIVIDALHEIIHNLAAVGPQEIKSKPASR